MAFLAILIVLLLCISARGAPFSTIPDEDWGYVDVRPGAHMFWWLYGCTDPLRDTKPLVMWLQGGPGASSTGFGNFVEIGPLDVNLTPRNTTWVQSANVLFVDNPVGTGYSYVDDMKELTTNVTGIADDLVVLLIAFLNKYQIFKELPFYVFSESYGGKMTAAFGVAINAAIKSGQITANFQGVTLGDSWISPIDSVKTWGPYLYATSLINSEGLKQLNALADKAEAALVSGHGAASTIIWGQMEDVVENLTDNVDFYNILRHNGNNEEIVNENELGKMYFRHVGIFQQGDLNALMNGPIKKKLNIPKNVTWGGQSGAVMFAQSEDFMKDVIHDVDTLLSSGTKVVIYNGQLDLIVDTMGTLEWIKKLQWSDLSSFLSAPRLPIYPPSGKRTEDTGAFLQHYKNLYFYWILKSGHMAPVDAGEMALEMLKMVIGVQ